MPAVLIVHGHAANPRINWFPWLKKRLGKRGCQVFVPGFPTLKGETPRNWHRVFKKYSRYLDEDSIIVAHSLGPAFVLSELERLERPIKAAFFVAGFTGLLRFRPEQDLAIKPFVSRKFKWGKIRKACARFYVINSDDDPAVPLAKGKALARRLGAELTIVKGGGHLNRNSGYSSFPLLLKLVLKELKKQ
jgi:predicted alpha/beta hydrolase family esterase